MHTNTKRITQQPLNGLIALGLVDSDESGLEFDWSESKSQWKIGVDATG